MRHKLLVAALLGTTFLTAEPAHAMPQVVPFIAGALGVAGSAAIATTAAYAAGAAFAATAIGGFIVNTVVAMGLSAITAKLGPRPSAPPPSAVMVNFAQPIAYANWVYGRTRKGGPIGFRGFANDKRYYVPILAAHPIQGIVQHWLDERIVSLTEEEDHGESNVAEKPIAGYGRIDPFTGAAGQVVNPGLNEAFEEVTSEFNFEGLSGAVLWAARPPQSSYTDIFPNGKQWAYAPVFDGKNDIFDPRTDSRGFTSNAALVFADWIVNVLGAEVDWAEVAEEADACDYSVRNAAGQIQPRWQINGTISAEQDYESQRAQIAGACDAFVYERTDGKVGFTVGRWIEPELTIGPDDFLALELIEGQWGADAPDEVSAVYIEPDNAWRETPSGAWVTRGVSAPVRDEPQLFLITSHNQAARMNKRIARTKLAKYQLRGTIGLKGYEILGGRSGGRAHRFVRVVHPEMQIDEYFEVGELVRENGTTFSITANSVRPEDFEFNAATEEPKRPQYGDIKGNSAIPVPENLTVPVSEGGTATIQWDRQSAAYLQDVRYRVAEIAPAWDQVSTMEGQQAIQITGLSPGTEYEVQIRNRSNGLGVSDWSPSILFTP